MDFSKVLKENIVSIPINAYSCQVKFNAPLVNSKITFRNLEHTLEDPIPHVSLEEDDVILFINDKCYVFDNCTELIELKMTRDFVELNTPHVFKVTSIRIKP